MEAAHQLLIDHICQVVRLNDHDIERVIDSFKPRVLKKKEILLRPGEISAHMRFITSGCLRTYYIDHKDQEHTLQFGIENWWINDLYSYITNTPARFFIQAVEAASLLQVQKKALEELFLTVPAMERFFRIKIQSAYVALQERTIDALSKQAEQRYIDFLNKYRSIEQRIPQYMVASYIGVAPESLSFIRKKISG